MDIIYYDHEFNLNKFTLVLYTDGLFSYYTQTFRNSLMDILMLKYNNEYIIVENYTVDKWNFLIGILHRYIK